MVLTTAVVCTMNSATTFNGGLLQMNRGSNSVPIALLLFIRYVSSKVSCATRLDVSLQTFQIAGRHVRGNMTLGEDIADCGGLHSSYLAMNKYIAEVEKRPASLFEKKLFFTSGAQNWCIKSQLKETILGVLTDEHAPAPVRVNAAFSQTPAFADAFQCKPGSKMNPVSKCDMW
jgi:predicted metalloendopeptidase